MKVRVRQVQEATVIYWVEVEVPDGLTTEEIAERAYEEADDGNYEVVFGPEVRDLDEVISQEIVDDGKGAEPAGKLRATK